MRTVAATSPRAARRDREHRPIVSAPLEGPSPPAAAARPVVLHVTQPTDAGAALCVAALAGDPVERGWEVAVACPREGSLSRVAADAGARRLGWEARRSPGPSIVGEVRSLR